MVLARPPDHLPYPVHSDLLAHLTRLPHRGAATPCEREAAALLSQCLTDMGAEVRLEPFRTPKTYVTVVYWLIGGLVLGLLLVRPGAWWTPALAWVYAGLAWLYFNWRYSPVVQFPVLHTAHNVVGRWPATTNRPESVRKLILMAHYDTAPVSALYGSSQRTFRASLIVSLMLMVLAAGLATLEAAGVGWGWLSYARYGLVLYFVLQAVMGTIGYYLHGYTNGASDNATGVVAALQTADRLRHNKPAHVDLEVVLTSAEEVGMLGAYYYVEKHRQSWPTGKTAAINFDTLGAGKLTVIEQTGTVEVIQYKNIATQTARELLQNESFREQVQTGRWHTADFDSVWFVRQHIPVLALCALDQNGEMPRIHRPEDTISAVDQRPLDIAVDLAEAVFRRLSVAL